jgi:hypothetical protein
MGAGHAERTALSAASTRTATPSVDRRDGKNETSLHSLPDASRQAQSVVGIKSHHLLSWKLAGRSERSAISTGASPIARSCTCNPSGVSILESLDHLVCFPAPPPKSPVRPVSLKDAFGRLTALLLSKVSYILIFPALRKPITCLLLIGRDKGRDGSSHPSVGFGRREYHSIGLDIPN